MPTSRPSAAPGRPRHEPPAAGMLIHAARAAQGLTLAELGRRTGYSASQISRYERGITPLTDITVLRRFADILRIPPQHLGLNPPASAGPVRHAGFAERLTPGAHGNTVGHERQWEDGEDPVRRRDMLTGTAALAGTAALSSISTARPRTTVTLQDVLYGKTEAAPVRLPELRRSITATRSNFQAARYDKVTSALPVLLAVAQATRYAASTADHGDACTLLADASLLAADFAVKINDDPLSWMTAGRALEAALTGNDPLAVADARRAVATAMRRAGHPGRACDLLIRACRDLEHEDGSNPDAVAMYGTLLSVAAYTAATAGNRGAAQDYITEAAAAASRIGPHGSSRIPAFGLAGVTLYQVSIAQVLGDNGTAIEHAKKLRTADIPTRERQGRYWVDVARAYYQWGKPRGTYAALLAAGRAAPAEVRYRPPVHRMTQALLSSPAGNTLPGLREFAHRTGLPA
jgi:transcriptional regulator with XRE-family HTH domain